MKKIKIGKNTVSVCTSLDDITYIRATLFKQWIAKILYNTDLPIFQETFLRYKQAIDKGQHSEGLILWQNFEQSIKLNKNAVDAYGICFALIALEKEESQNDYSEDYLIEKLERWNKQGLKRETVETEVVNFTKAFPSLYLILRGQAEGLDNLTKII